MSNNLLNSYRKNQWNLRNRGQGKCRKAKVKSRKAKSKKVRKWKVKSKYAKGESKK